MKTTNELIINNDVQCEAESKRPTAKVKRKMPPVTDLNDLKENLKPLFLGHETSIDVPFKLGTLLQQFPKDVLFESGISKVFKLKQRDCFRVRIENKEKFSAFIMSSTDIESDWTTLCETSRILDSINSATEPFDCYFSAVKHNAYNVGFFMPLPMIFSPETNTPVIEKPIYKAIDSNKPIQEQLFPDSDDIFTWNAGFSFSSSGSGFFSLTDKNIHFWDLEEDTSSSPFPTQEL